LSAPDWVIIKRISEVSIPQEYFQIDMEEWPRIARERINKFVQKNEWYPGEGVNRANYEREIYEEFAGHGLLRLVAAEDPRVQGWLIEQEGDLFDWRLRKAKTTEIKVEVAKYLFGEDNVIAPRDVWSRFDIEKQPFKEFKMKARRSGSMAVRFTCVPKMISNRAALLVNGWVIALIDDFASSLKSTFEKLLRLRIRESKESLDRIVRSSVSEPIKELKEELSKIIHSMSVTSGKIEWRGYKLFSRQSVFPQCMMDLYNEVMSQGHISHEERLQLGLFLKNIGMSVDEQLLFWYEKAVDNVGMTYEQFANGPPGYQIRYMYGLEGGRTDYSAHKCASIQDNGFCTFLHQSVATIDENLRKEIKNPSKLQEDLMRELSRKVVDKKPGEACALMFQLRYIWKAHPIRHPINYLSYAARALNIVKKEDEEEKEKPKSD
jgi:DNA primase large subunit